jgi:hypothetical protein
MVGDYFELESEKRNEEVEDVEVEPADEDKTSEEYEAWYLYQRRQYREHLGMTQYGADISYTDAVTTLVTLSNLFA